MVKKYCKKDDDGKTQKSMCHEEVPVYDRLAEYSLLAERSSATGLVERHAERQCVRVADRPTGRLSVCV